MCIVDFVVFWLGALLGGFLFQGVVGGWDLNSVVVLILWLRCTVWLFVGYCWYRLVVI